MVTVGFNLLFISLCTIAGISRFLGRKQSSWCTGKRLEPAALVVLGMWVMDAEKHLQEHHGLISFALALGSGCLIKCKHLNDLSPSVVDFLSVIPAKLFALLTSCQAFQVMEKCFVKFCTSLDLSRTLIKQWRGVKREFTSWEKRRYPGDKLLSPIQDL